MFGESACVDTRGDDPWLQHGLHRQHGCERGPSRTSNESRRNRGRCAMGYRRIWAASERAHPNRRLDGRSVWAQRMFLFGTTVFALASCACGVAPNIRDLVMARAVQGLGAAFLVPGSLSIISASFSEQEPWPCHWNMVWLHGDGHGCGTGPGRMVDRARFLALGILH